MHVWLISILALLVKTGGASRLLVLFIDGFRWDYVDRYALELPGIRRLLETGASVQRIRPVFPTDCYPNIYSIFTGQLPAKHGVLFNDMFVSSNGDAFSHEDPATRLNASQWVHADTLWQKLRAKGRKSYLYHLPTCVPDSTNAFHGDFCEPYDRARMQFSHFNGTVHSALDALLGGVHFTVVYNDLLDQEAHSKGPDSPRLLDEMLPALDRVLVSLLDRLDAVNVDDLHVMILSDHGLTTQRHLIDLEQLSTLSVLNVINRGSAVSIWAKPGEEDKLLTMRLPSNYNVTRYRPSDILPAGETAKFGELLPTVYLMAQAGFVFKTRSWPSVFEPKQGNRKGWHGYHPSVADMQTPLIVYGPRVRSGHRLLGDHAYESVHAYDLMASLLDASLLHADRSADIVYELLQQERTSLTFSIGLLLIGLSVGLLVTSLVALLALKCANHSPCVREVRKEDKMACFDNPMAFPVPDSAPLILASN